MQPRFAPIIGLFALVLIAFASARAAAPQRLYLPLMLAPTAVGEQTPIAPRPNVTATPSVTPSPTATPSTTPTATVTETAPFKPTATVTPSVTVTATAMPSATATMPPPVIEVYGMVSFWPEYPEWRVDGNTEVCERRNDNLWRSTIPPEHFQPMSNLTYPNVGEVMLENVDTGAQYAGRITASTNSVLYYRLSDLPPGDYRLIVYLFYRHPLEPPSAIPRMYGRIDTGVDVVSELQVTFEPGPSSPTIVELNVPLRLSGDVCLQP